MNRRDAIKKLSLTTLLVACGKSPIDSPFCGLVDDGDKLFSSATNLIENSSLITFDQVTVSNTQEFWEALRAGQTAIKITSAVYLHEPINLNDYITTGNHFVLEGVGGWAGGTIARQFDGPEPLIRASRFRQDGSEQHWEMRMRGLAFHGHEDRYPNGGPSLQLDYLQLSIFEDIRFQNHPYRPFVLGSDTINAFEFRDIYMHFNGERGQLLNCSDFRIRGGSYEDHMGRNTGLEVIGPPRSRQNSYPGTGLIEDVHQEFSKIIVTGIDDLSVRGGYRLSSEMHFNDCNGRFDFQPTGTWAYSAAYRDGKLIYPVSC